MLKIFNSATKKKEKFQVKKNKCMNLYVCGVTVYDLCHVGHARTFIFFDIVVRYFKFLDYKVFYVRNITDIDDKIIQCAKKFKQSIKKYSTRMIKEMKKDLNSLNLLLPTKEPLITEYIFEIIFMIQKLLNKKIAYISENGDVLFKISKFKDYGKFSQCFSNLFNKNFLQKIPVFFQKKNVDFVLWKLQKKKKNEKEIFWNSPWGLGRPGWHIECSAINYKFFPDGADIHGGGIDLLFPHHENERAQSISFQKNSCAYFWVHVGMIIFNNSKMSKSLKNIITIRYLRKYYTVDVLKYYLLSTHYRRPLNFLEKNLISSKNIMNRIYSVLNLYNFSKVSFKIIFIEQKKFINLFMKALENDFNTPKACSILYKLSKYIKSLYGKNFFLEKYLVFTLLYLGNFLGIFLKFSFKKSLNIFQNCLDSKYYIKNLLKLRNKYRKNKQWDLADDIREKLYKLKIFINDSKFDSEYFF